MVLAPQEGLAVCLRFRHLGQQGNNDNCVVLMCGNRPATLSQRLAINNYVDRFMQWCNFCIAPDSALAVFYRQFKIINTVMPVNKRVVRYLPNERNENLCIAGAPVSLQFACINGNYTSVELFCGDHYATAQEQNMISNYVDVAAKQIKNLSLSSPDASTVVLFYHQLLLFNQIKPVQQ